MPGLVLTHTPSPSVRQHGDSGVSLSAAGRARQRGVLGESGLMDSTVTTMMHAVRRFLRFAHIDGPRLSDSAVNARLPNVHRDECRTQGLDRLELKQRRSFAPARSRDSEISSRPRHRHSGLRRPPAQLRLLLGRRSRWRCWHSVQDPMATVHIDAPE
jgi:hypothetical protein